VSDLGTVLLAVIVVSFAVGCVALLLPFVVDMPWLG
jgi:hypothetical protein